jgi:hypothetical protein
MPQVRECDAAEEQVLRQLRDGPAGIKNQRPATRGRSSVSAVRTLQIELLVHERLAFLIGLLGAVSQIDANCCRRLSLIGAGN